MYRIFIVTFLINYSLFAQKSSIEIGLLRSNFNYQNAFQDNDITFGANPSLTLNYIIQSDSSKLGYGITYQEYNSKAVDGGQIYSWNTNYLGPKITFKAISVKSFDIQLGISALSLIDGRQLINGSTYNLSKSSEFNGLWLSPTIEFNLGLLKTNKNKISVKYCLSNSLKIGNQGNERLRFFNHAILFVFDIEKSKNETIDEL